MNKSILLFTSILMATPVFAAGGTGVSEGPGPVGAYTQCSGQLKGHGKVSFEVRATATPSIVDSVLLRSRSNELIAHLYCEKGSEVAKEAPSAGSVDWTCGETDLDQNTDGGFTVQVMTGGVTGVTTAQVFEKQMFPQSAKVLGTLLCN